MILYCKEIRRVAGNPHALDNRDEIVVRLIGCYDNGDAPEFRIEPPVLREWKATMTLRFDPLEWDDEFVEGRYYTADFAHRPNEEEG